MGDRNQEYLIYGLKTCGYCAAAQELLSSLGYEYSYFNLDDKQDFLTEVKRFYSHKTVPIILRMDSSTGSVKFIGGYSELQEHVND